MGTDIIYINGKFIKYNEAVTRFGLVPGYDFVYQRIHTFAHTPLHAETHIGILDISCERLYGTTSGLTADILTQAVGQLLKLNNYQEGSNVITVYIAAPESADTPPAKIIICEKQLLYRGYVLWHKTFKAIVTPYEYPFPEHKTAVSYTAHIFPKGYAERSEADIAIMSSHSGVITGAGENPIFGVRGNSVLTTPLHGFGVAESVERRLGIAAAEAAELLVYEETLTTDNLKSYDELFIVDQQGIISIGECEGKLYPNSMAKHIAAKMNDIRLE